MHPGTSIKLSEPQQTGGAEADLRQPEKPMEHLGGPRMPYTPFEALAAPQSFWGPICDPLRL